MVTWRAPARAGSGRWALSRSTGPPGTADRALLRALAGWGRAGGERFWDHFSPAWRDRLRAGWESGAAGVAAPEAAVEILGREHAAEARPDPDRVHPSWWVRALQDESPAVRRAVAIHAPEPIRGAV